MSRRFRSHRTLGAETLILCVAVFLTLTGSPAFWRGLLAGREWSDAGTWSIVAGVGVMLTALHFAVGALFGPRMLLRPVLAILLLIAASAGFYAQRYGVVLDPTMILNVLATDVREAGELLTLDMGLHFAFLGLLPAALVLSVKVRKRPWKRAVLIRLSALAVSVLVGVLSLVAVFQDFASVMRNQKSLRYTLAPTNVLWSLGVVAAETVGHQTTPREPPDPALRAERPGRRPTLLVIVVGETVRAANWQLNGYARETTPHLAARQDLVSFSQATACGTATEVSLPCMFSPYGRADYDATRIQATDSLLHLLARSGFAVVWRDNQSGCKGVCSGLPEIDLSRSTVPGLCSEGRCYDEILLHELNKSLDAQPGDQVVVLHPLGNHGPAYYRRYPAEDRHWTPACEKNELRDCSRDEIVNAYDNAIRYTDRMLAQTLDLLSARTSTHDVAMVYLSDHGESLGERGLYLHGVPYAIAPREQLEIPKFWWLPESSAQGLGIDLDCLRKRASEPVSHDHLYHSVLGLLEVRTPRYRADRDVFSGCRRR